MKDEDATLREPAFPLSWPAGVPRTRSTERKRASFKNYRQPLSIDRAIRRLQSEIQAFTVGRRAWRIDPDRVVISANLRLRKDGLPYGDQREPEDPGVAVYFALDGERRCIASDKWDRAADNIAGIAAAIGALRGLERWVNDANVRAAFRGFAALPDPNNVDWRRLFGMNGDASAEAVRTAYRRLAAERHPDRGGSDEMMAELNRARDQALRELEP